MSSPSTPLIAILLVATSSSGTSIVFRWPPYPESSARLVRPLPYRQGTRHGLDGLYQASHLPDSIEDLQEVEDAVKEMEQSGAWTDDSEEYLWHRPSSAWGNTVPPSPTSGSGSVRGRSTSRPPSASGSKSSSPVSKDRPLQSYTGSGDDQAYLRQDYDTVFDFDASTLAEILSPARQLCYQKFELIVDDLAFVGHPVCVARDGEWRMDNITAPPPKAEFSPERERGRSLPPSTPPNGINSEPTSPPDRSPPNVQIRMQRALPASQPERVTFFHLVLVIDRPDPASYHTSDLSALLAPFHAQVAFKLTAGLLHEEARTGYVSRCCAQLVEMQESAIGRGLWYEEFAGEASEYGANALAILIREVYDAVRVDGTCKVTINHIVVDVQLPPRSMVEDWGEENEEEGEWGDGEDGRDEEAMDRAMFGWVPKLKPWSALLMLDVEVWEETEETQVDAKEEEEVTDEQRDMEEMRRKFFATVSPTLSLSDISNLLDLDLYTDVFPLARELIYMRKAKLVDVVRENLKSIYYPNSSLAISLSDHMHAFSRHFPALPHLATLLSSLSLTPVSFASLLPSPKERQVYLDALIWMLKRDLLEMMHVRIRVVATQELKEVVWRNRMERAKLRRLSMTTTEPSGSEDLSPDNVNVPTADGLLSPMMLQPTRLPHVPTSSEEDYDESSSDMLENPSKSEDEMDFLPSVIIDPGRATKLERRWLDEMSREKDTRIVNMFERLLPFFDGKTTMDEILYRTEVRRRGLREVLHQFDPYVLTVLHP